MQLGESTSPVSEFRSITEISAEELRNLTGRTIEVHFSDNPELDLPHYLVTKVCVTQNANDPIVTTLTVDEIEADGIPTRKNLRVRLRKTTSIRVVS